MKKQITFEIGEKPQFDNALDIEQTLKFLSKVEETVKLYNKHSKALKDYMVKNDITDLKGGEFNAHISTGTARMNLNQELVETFVKQYGKKLDDFKTLGNPPKSLEIYRD
jgi:hypothetical protein